MTRIPQSRLKCRMGRGNDGTYPSRLQAGYSFVNGECQDGS
eukprot:CAMPEP_0171410440 /NCGR_PEP_ID=MMETSP0880-20121228/27445_1 /TAXON_ID=67004 /ORGANISM="Thalassiosira weissflogii, Strain CCMP1336" /LENGTH=40 /DNA_ID= /DNA_START= /DNA_END= /DNA_ORIENTATION=